MHNIFVLFGSPKKDGNTAKLVECFLEGILSKNVDIFYCYDSINIRPCTGCGECGNTGKCTANDEMFAVIQNIQKCDTIIFAAPVYFLSFPAPMKTVIDRLQPLWHIFGSKDNPKKQGILIATCGGRIKEDIIKRQASAIFASIGASLAYSFIADNTDKYPVDNRYEMKRNLLLTAQHMQCE